MTNYIDGVSDLLTRLKTRFIQSMLTGNTLVFYVYIRIYIILEQKNNTSVQLDRQAKITVHRESHLNHIYRITNMIMIARDGQEGSQKTTAL